MLEAIANSLPMSVGVAMSPLSIAFVMVMLREGFAPPTRNLEEPDAECAPLDYLVGEPRPMKLDAIMSNNFAFGGINTSLIIRRA